MAPQSFQLVMRSGPNPGKAFVLDKSEIIVGRDSSNDIVINDAEISRKHARLLLQPGGYMLEDLGSTNGTFVNGQRLMGPHSLQQGELVLLGENVTLTYEAVQFDPDATMVSTSMGQPTMRPDAGIPRQEPPRYEPPVQVYREPEPVYTPEFEPAYSGQIPTGPAVFEEPPPARRAKSGQTWVLAGCGCLLLSMCACIGLLFLLDSMNLLCNPVLRPIINLVMSLFNPIFGTSYACP
jgi:predicted component of type VI protein secretion system